MTFRREDIRYHHLMGGRGGGAPGKGVLRAGFVLAGGESSRMGRDKALLPFGGSTLLGYIADCVLRAARSVTIVGRPERYSALGYPVVADRVPGCGPLGGLHTALSITEADWNLVVACDMPGLTAEFLEDLLRAVDGSEADCLVPEDDNGLHPLCAIYHARCLGAAAAAIDRKTLKMREFVSGLRMEKWRAGSATPLRNINTPEQWSAR